MVNPYTENLQPKMTSEALHFSFSCSPVDLVLTNIFYKIHNGVSGIILGQRANSTPSNYGYCVPFIKGLK